MFFYLLVGMCLAYEIHKILDFEVFKRIAYLIYHYTDQIKQRKGNLQTVVLKISVTEFFYYVILIIGVWGSQCLFFGSLLVLSLTSSTILKNTKHKMFSVIYFIDIVLSSIILILILVNFYFFKMESIDFFKYLISLI